MNSLQRPFHLKDQSFGRFDSADQPSRMWLSARTCPQSRPGLGAWCSSCCLLSFGDGPWPLDKQNGRVLLLLFFFQLIFLHSLPSVSASLISWLFESNSQTFTILLSAALDDSRSWHLNNRPRRLRFFIGRGFIYLVGSIVLIYSQRSYPLSHSFICIFRSAPV